MKAETNHPFMFEEKFNEWERSGLLEGLNITQQNEMAYILECAKNILPHLKYEDKLTAEEYNEILDDLVPCISFYFPFIRRVYGILSKDPMMLENTRMTEKDLDGYNSEFGIMCLTHTSLLARMFIYLNNYTIRYIEPMRNDFLKIDIEMEMLILMTQDFIKVIVDEYKNSIKNQSKK